MSVLVKNIIDKNKYKILSRKVSLKKYFHGMFLKIGGRKIPPGRSAEIDNKFQSQIDLLLQLGAIELTDGKDNHIPDLGKLKPYNITSKARRITSGQRVPPNMNVSTSNFPDFIVISTDEDLVFPDSLEDEQDEYLVDADKAAVQPSEEPPAEEKVAAEPKVEEVDKDPLEDIVEKAFTQPENDVIPDPPKRKRGRPKGSKNKKKEKVSEV